MADSWKTIRVFVSSTFRDMPFDFAQSRYAARHYLVTVVFPELHERIEQSGLELFHVDLRFRLRPSWSALRWAREGYGGQGGVPERGADGEKANSRECCREWIDRVEPVFVCMPSQRYGWASKPKGPRD